MKWLVCFLSFFPLLLWQAFSYAENVNIMDKVYRDESHCLVAPEIRGKNDNPISCYCRDAIMDARYVYQNYLITGKDRNLNGVYLRLWSYVQQMCGEQYDVLKASETKEYNGTAHTLHGSILLKKKFIRFNLTVKASEP